MSHTELNYPAPSIAIPAAGQPLAPLPLNKQNVEALVLPTYAETDKFTYMQLYRRRNALLHSLAKADECLVDYSHLTVTTFEDVWPTNQALRKLISQFNKVSRAARANATRRLRNNLDQGHA